MLDEPAYRGDFLALRFFGRLFKEGISGVAGGARMRFRVDISRPQWRREHLDGLVGLSVVSSDALRSYGPLVRETAARFGEEFWMYGEAPHPSEP